MPDCSGVLPRVCVISIARCSVVKVTYSLVEQGQLVGTAQHADHKEGHGAHRAELGAVAEEREGDEGVLVAVVLPAEEDKHEDAAEGEQEDDAPV